MPGHRGKVLLAMSGGVDSSVAAALLVREGYEVVGCFMRLGSPGESLDELIPAGNACDTRRVKIGHQGCCSINDAADARLVAAELGIPFYVCNFKKDFGRIIDYFVDEYAAGRTPNPCVRCNDWLKFGKLHEYAGQIGADFVASGHYARIGRAAGGERELQLLRGIDHRKDQSYVLFGIPRPHLAHTLLPIGEMEKSQVRDRAQQWGLPVFDKPDSQEICFVPDNDYAGLVERRRPELARAGTIVDSAGNPLGEHAGQHRFTIGQRRGLGIGGTSTAPRSHPLYVLNKNPSTNTVTVGPREQLLAGGCRVGEANWLTGQSVFADWQPVLARYRYNSPPVPAEARLLADGADETPSGRQGRFEVRFDARQQAVAAGQALVLYSQANPDLVLGGGWIEAVF